MDYSVFSASGAAVLLALNAFWQKNGQFLNRGVGEESR